MGEPTLNSQCDQEPDTSECAPEDAISDPRETIIAEYEQRIPPSYRDVYRRGISGLSRRAAVRAFCLECVGWMPSEVRKCTVPGCPLYLYRLKG